MPFTRPAFGSTRNNNCCVQEQRVQVQSMQRHHGANTRALCSPLSLSASRTLANTHAQSLIIVRGFKLHCLFFIDKEKSGCPYTWLWLTPCVPRVIMTRYLYAEHACEFHAQRREVTGAHLHICKSGVVTFACPHLFQWTRPSVEPVFEHA